MCLKWNCYNVSFSWLHGSHTEGSHCVVFKPLLLSAALELGWMCCLIASSSFPPHRDELRRKSCPSRESQRLVGQLWREFGVKWSLLVGLAAKWLSLLGMENTVHTPEAAGVLASVTFAYTYSLGHYVPIYIHTHTQIAEHRGYFCPCCVSEQRTHVVLTLLDYGD